MYVGMLLIRIICKLKRNKNDLPLPEVALSTKSCLTNSICTTAIFIEFPILASAYMLDT